MKILVCGEAPRSNPPSLGWTDVATIEAWLARFPAGTILVHGAAPGADTIAATIGKARGFDVRGYPARWQAEGNSAGPRRNARMLAEEHTIAELIGLVLAFTANLWRGEKLSGTGDMVKRAHAAGIVCTVVTPGARP